MGEPLSATEVSRNFAEYLNRVAYRRETFVVVRGGKPVAELRPLPLGRRLSELPGLIASLPGVDDNFASDVEAARAELAAVKVVDPWES